MVLAIFTLILVSTIAMIVAMVQGYLIHTNPDLVLKHVTIGLPSALLVILTHSITMFYFIGSGKTLKEAVAANNLDPAYIEKTKVFKRITSPLATYTMLAAVVLACLGGAAQVGKVNPRLHEVTAWVTLLLHIWTCVQSVRCIIANQLLADQAVQELNRKVQNPS